MQSLLNVYDSVREKMYTGVEENNEIFSLQNYFEEYIYIYIVRANDSLPKFTIKESNKMVCLIKITIICVSGSIKFSLY